MIPMWMTCVYGFCIVIEIWKIIHMICSNNGIIIFNLALGSFALLIYDSWNNYLSKDIVIWLMVGALFSITNTGFDFCLMAIQLLYVYVNIDKCLESRFGCKPWWHIGINDKGEVSELRYLLISY